MSQVEGVLGDITNTIGKEVDRASSRRRGIGLGLLSDLGIYCVNKWEQLNGWERSCLKQLFSGIDGSLGSWHPRGCGTHKQWHGLKRVANFIARSRMENPSLRVEGSVVLRSDEWEEVFWRRVLRPEQLSSAASAA